MLSPCRMVIVNWLSVVDGGVAGKKTAAGVSLPSNQKEYEPATLGVPRTSPLPFPSVTSVSPGGKAPDRMRYVYGSQPPPSRISNLWAYGCPVVPTGGL